LTNSFQPVLNVRVQWGAELSTDQPPVGLQLASWKNNRTYGNMQD